MSFSPRVHDHPPLPITTLNLPPRITKTNLPKHTPSHSIHFQTPDITSCSSRLSPITNFPRSQVHSIKTLSSLHKPTLRRTLQSITPLDPPQHLEKSPSQRSSQPGCAHRSKTQTGAASRPCRPRTAGRARERARPAVIINDACRRIRPRARASVRCCTGRESRRTRAGDTAHGRAGRRAGGPGERGETHRRRYRPSS